MTSITSSEKPKTYLPFRKAAFSMEILADVGGRPGLDCKGFCSYCYFKGVKSVSHPSAASFACPSRRAATYRSRAIVEGYPGFKPMDAVVFVGGGKVHGRIPDKVTITAAAI